MSITNNIAELLTLAPKGDWLNFRWALFFMFGVSFLLLKIYKLDKYIALASSYVLSFAIFKVVFGYNNLLYHGQILLGVVYYVSALLILSNKPGRLTKYTPFYLIYCFSMTVFCRYFDTSIWGPGGPSSMNSLTICLALFLSFGSVRNKYKVILALISAGFIYHAQGTVAIVAFLAGIFAYLFSIYRKKWVLLPMTGAGAWLYLHGGEYIHEFNSFSGRLPIWHLSVEWLSKSKTWLLGNGLGSWSYMIPKLQDMTGIKRGAYFQSAHSDILQSVFEFGIIGVTLFSIAALGLIIKSWKLRKHHLNAFWAALLVGMAGYMPLHTAPEALTVLIAISSLREYDRNRKGELS